MLCAGTSYREEEAETEGTGKPYKIGKVKPVLEDKGASSRKRVDEKWSSKKLKQMSRDDAGKL